MTDEPRHPEEKRCQIRHPLTGDLTGAIFSARTGSLIPCIARDVSASGLRIVLALHLPEGSELVLKVHGREVRLVAMWCRKEDSKKGYFSCGLRCDDPAVDLVTVFTVDGKLDGSAPTR